MVKRRRYKKDTKISWSRKKKFGRRIGTVKPPKGYEIEKCILLQRGADLATNVKRRRKCPKGRVKSGPRKGMCRKKIVRRK